MNLNYPLSDEAIELISARFKVLSEPMRLKLLNFLREGERCVSELVELTESGQANVSKHLGILMEAGMIDRKKKGLKVYYFVSDHSVYNLCELVCNILKERFTQQAKTLDLDMK